MWDVPIFGGATGIFTLAYVGVLMRDVLFMFGFVAGMPGAR